MTPPDGKENQFAPAAGSSISVGRMIAAAITSMRNLQASIAAKLR
jgi:hypothetical protein